MSSCARPCREPQLVADRRWAQRRLHPAGCAEERSWIAGRLDSDPYDRRRGTGCRRWARPSPYWRSPWFVLVTTGSATKLGLVLGIGSIPFVTLPLFAGPLIARIGARQTMVIADAARLPLLAAIPALYSLHALSFPLLVVLVALANVFMAAHFPAQRLVLAEVVGDEESLVARVNAYLDGAQTTAPLVGPALAGDPDRRTRRAERAVRRCCHLRSRSHRRRLVRATEEPDDRG